MAEYRIKSKNIHSSIHGRIECRHRLKKVLKFIHVPKSINLVQLFQNELFVFYNVDCQKGFEDQVQSQYEK